MDVFSNQLRSGAKSLGVELSDESLESLCAYQSLLSRWAPKVNLVADWSPRTTVGIHFLDSLALSRILPKDATPLVDIGTGAGFPGLVQAILTPERRVTLIEPITKRASFLQQVIVEAKLKNCTIENGRSTSLPLLPGHIVVARAVLPPDAWVVEGSRLIDSEGWVVLMTAQPPEPSTLKAAQEAGLTKSKEDAVELPFARVPRTNTLFQRTGS